MYCPNCIIELIKDRKKLGQNSVWLICPKCGLRTRETSTYLINKEIEDFYEIKKRINNNENKFNKEE